MAEATTKVVSGTIVGETIVGPNGNKYYRFIGVPYARITGIFEPASRLVNYGRHNRGRWLQNLNCFSTCIPDGDHTPFRTLGPEDLPNENWLHGRYLFLNIYTPLLPPKWSYKPFPIMVFLPGEHYFEGYNKSQFYDPCDLVAKEVVVIIVHFRTGILGFLYNRDVDPNLGLEDIIWALRWIERNGSDFKGNSERVTIWGQGFGSVYVSYLLVSNEALEVVNSNQFGVTYRYKFFNKAIMQSGTFEHSWSKGLNAIKPYVQQWMDNIEDEGPRSLYYLLRNADIQQMINPRFNYIREFHANERILFGPLIVEGTKFLPLDPETLLITNNLVKPIPILIGFNSSEGFLANILKDGLEENIATYKPYPDIVAEHIKTQTCQNYYGGDVPNLDGLYKMITDVCFVRGVMRMVKLLKCPRNMPDNTLIFLYKFSYDDPELNIMKKLMHRSPDYDYPGACHGDELGYLFKTPLRPKVLNPKQQAAVDKMVKIWTHFAKTGVPDLDWPCVRQRKEDIVSYRNIGEEDEMLQFENTRFLNSLVEKVPY